MSLDSYTNIKTEIANWLDSTTLTAVAGTLLTMGENRIYRDLRIACMETALNSAVVSGVVAIPARYKELKFAYLDGSPVLKLERKDAEWIYHSYPSRSGAGLPKFIAREASNFIFGPYVDSGYTLKGVAYCGLPSLSDSNLTNWFTDNAGELLLFAALAEAEPFLKNDARVALWEGKYTSVKNNIQDENDNEEFSGSPLSATVR